MGWAGGGFGRVGQAEGRVGRELTRVSLLLLTSTPTGVCGERLPATMARFQLTPETAAKQTPRLNSLHTFSTFLLFRTARSPHPRKDCAHAPHAWNARTLAHARTHARMHAWNTRTQRQRAQKHARTHAHARKAPAQARMHARKHERTHIRACMRIPVHACARSHKKLLLACTCVCMRARVRDCDDACAGTCVHASHPHP